MDSVFTTRASAAIWEERTVHNTHSSTQEKALKLKLLKRYQCNPEGILNHHNN
jgi:hypothetical protein